MLALQLSLRTPASAESLAIRQGRLRNEILKVHFSKLTILFIYESITVTGATFTSQITFASTSYMQVFYGTLKSS